MDFAAADHRPHRAPARILERADRRRIEARGDRLRCRQLAPGNVVFKERVGAGDHDPLEPAHDPVGRRGIVEGTVLHEHRLVAADLGDHPEPVGRERAAGLHEVDDGVGDAELDHHLDAPREGNEVGFGTALGEP